MLALLSWNSGESFAYCAMKTVVNGGVDNLTFNMVGPTKPYGATLTAVQVALVTDPNADAAGEYTPLAVASK